MCIISTTSWHSDWLLKFSFHQVIFGFNCFVCSIVFVLKLSLQLLVLFFWWTLQNLEAWPHHSWWKRYEVSKNLLSSLDLKKVLKDYFCNEISVVLLSWFDIFYSVLKYLLLAHSTLNCWAMFLQLRFFYLFETNLWDATPQTGEIVVDTCCIA